MIYEVMIMMVMMTIINTHPYISCPYCWEPTTVGRDHTQEAYFLQISYAPSKHHIVHALLAKHLHNNDNKEMWSVYGSACAHIVSQVSWKPHQKKYKLVVIL